MGFYSHFLCSEIENAISSRSGIAARTHRIQASVSMCEWCKEEGEQCADGEAGGDDRVFHGPHTLNVGSGASGESEGVLYKVVVQNLPPFRGL